MSCAIIRNIHFDRAKKHNVDCLQLTSPKQRFHNLQCLPNPVPQKASPCPSILQPSFTCVDRDGKIYYNDIALGMADV